MKNQPTEKESMLYTHTEETVKKYKASQAVAAAKSILLQRHNVNVNGVCLDPLTNAGLTQDSLITLKTLNELSDQIVDSSLFYSNGYWCGW